MVSSPRGLGWGTVSAPLTTKTLNNVAIEERLVLPSRTKHPGPVGVAPPAAGRTEMLAVPSNVRTPQDRRPSACQPEFAFHRHASATTSYFTRGGIGFALLPHDPS